MERNMNSPVKITVAGAGFAALTGLKELRKQMRKGDDLRSDIQPLLKELKVNFVQGSVTGISEDGRVLITDNGDVENDALLIATGGRFIKKLPGIENAITICEGIAAAEAMGEKINALSSGTIALGFGGNPKEPSAMRGGPMFELLFGLDTWLRKQGKRDKIKLVFFNPAPAPGKRLGEKAVKGLLSEMKKRGIETHLGHKIQSFENNIVKTEGGEIPADLILFMPGMTGPAWVQGSPLTQSEGGFTRQMEWHRLQIWNRFMWQVMQAATPARTGCPSRHIWPISRPKRQ
jgi:sulfide:quinone oxidoreductase